ncbi:DUF4381 family protein [Verrucomicrobiaceae bacterium N1E253]|uniref:DUF4381 family protein n=1 Tax=Oceaniferula marina TaxID=2748318 RepID=A0A851GRH9_9BACT|nr:DUF4381 family protein [Oceaniferula marina]NWK57617.1 DUF4381 family protein [Oceaniferula marina]
MADFHDITEPNDFFPETETPWWLISLVILACIIFTGLLIQFIRQRKQHKLKATMLDRAREQLAKLREEAPNLPPHGVALHLSLILRRYLAAAFHDPALFETNEEFSLRDSALEQVHPDSREPVTLYLHELSQIKYIPESQADIPNLIDQADQLIASIEINVGDPDDKQRQQNKHRHRSNL